MATLQQALNVGAVSSLHSCAHTTPLQALRSQL
jgi:hypothetical protein